MSELEDSGSFAEELGAAAVELGVGNPGAGNNFGRNKDGGSVGTFTGKRNGDTDNCGRKIRALGFEAEAAARHVETGDDVVGESLAANAGEVADSGPAMDAAIRGSGAHGFGDGFDDRGDGLLRIGGGRTRMLEIQWPRLEVGRIENGNGIGGGDRLKGIGRTGKRRGMGGRPRGDGGRKFPDCGERALIAIAHQATVNGADVEFEIAVNKSDGRAAGGADEFERPQEFCGGRRRRECNLPEIELFFQESNTVGV